MKKREWLIAARKEKGFETQAEFAQSLGMAKSYLSAIENGERTPSGKTALKMANLLDIKMEMFFEDEEEEKRGINTLIGK